MRADLVIVYKHFGHAVGAVEFYITYTVCFVQVFAVNALALKVAVFAVLSVFAVPCMRQGDDAFHALFFKFPILVYIDDFQIVDLRKRRSADLIINILRARVNTVLF